MAVKEVVSLLRSVWC